MKRHILGFAAASLFALGVTSAWAQPTQDGGGRAGGPGGGGSNVAGGGVTASGGGNPSSGSSSSVGSSGNSGGGSGAATSSSAGWGDTRVGGSAPRAEAPRRAPGYSDDGGQRRRGSAGSGGQGRAVPRGSAGSSGGEGRAVPRGEGRGTASGPGATSVTIDGGGREPSQGRQRAPVPEYSRPRGNRTPVGTPVERTTQIRSGRGIGLPGYYYDPYFGYGYRGYYGYYSRFANAWYPSYGFGLGYFYDPFAYGYGGYGGYGGSPYYGGGGGGYYQSRGYDTGSLRLKVAPRDAKVYVDGYFVGVVDSFDGVFQKLTVESGTHRVEIRADGFEPAQFEIMVTPGETITYKGELNRITP